MNAGGSSTRPSYGYRKPERPFASEGWFAALCVCCLLCSVLLVSLPFVYSIGLVVAVTVFIVCFVNVEVSLYLLVFSMLLSPEFGLGGLSGGSSTTASRGITIRSEDLLLVVMGLAWLARMGVHKDLGLLRDTPLNRPIGLYAAICFFSTGMGLIWGYVSGVTGFFYVLKYIEYFVVYFMVVNNVHSRTQIKRLIGAMLLTAFIVSLTAIAQIPSGERVSAPFEGERGEPNTLGGYLLFIGAIAGGIALRMDRGRARLALVALLGVMFVPFLATQSRGSYLALPFVFLTTMVLHRQRRPLLLLILVTGLVGGLVYMPESVRDRIEYTFNQGRTQQERIAVGGVQLDTSTTERLRSWENALNDVADSPLWGFGVTGYGFLDAQYPRILVENGVFGLALFGLLIFGVFKQLFHLRRHSQDRLYNGLASGLIAGLVGLLVHALAANTFIIVRVMEPFWLAVGLAACANERLRD